MAIEPERPAVESEPSASVSSVARQLVVAQGFTLSIAGTLAILLERHPRPGPFVIWLFVAGATLGFVLVVAVSGAYRHGTPGRDAAGLQMFHVAALIVVPLVASAVFCIPSAHVAFPLAGLAISSIYVLAVGAVFRGVDRLSRR